MADILNPSFEDEGIALGQALNWTEVYPLSPLTAEEWGLFAGTDRSYPWEGYEQEWQDNQNAQAAFGSTDLISAEFEYGNLTFDRFDTSWAEPAAVGAPVRWNHHSQFLLDWTNFTKASFDAATPEAVEDYEEEWNDNEDAVASLLLGIIVYANFDVGAPEAFEDYEEEWDDNETLEAEFQPLDPLGAASTTALFDGGANAYENFEGVWVETLP